MDILYTILATPQDPGQREAYWSEMAMVFLGLPWAYFSHLSGVPSRLWIFAEACWDGSSDGGAAKRLN